MIVTNYDKIELQFEECSIILTSNVIEKFQVDKVEQFIEKKYNPENEYNVYIVINRILAEEVWEKELANTFKGFLQTGTPEYDSLTECISENSIYDITIYKGEQKIAYSPVWSYTEFTNKYQHIGITDDKIMIRIVDI